MDKKYYSVTTQKIEITDNGKVIKKKEQYLVLAYSVTDAEAIVTEKCDVDTNFRVISVLETKFLDVFSDE